ncbi:MAG: hypothetical protein ACI4AM_02465 [Muribaculaceae bacterium]
MAAAAGDSGRQMPTSLADVSQALTALDERIADGGERIAVGRDMLSAIELFECVGDLSIDLSVEGDSVISADDARLLCRWYRYNRAFLTDSMAAQFFTLLSDYNSRPNAGQLTYGDRMIQQDVLRDLRKLQAEFFFRKYHCATTLTHLTTEVALPAGADRLKMPRHLGWVKTTDPSAIVDTLNIELNYAEYDHMLTKLQFYGIASEQRALEIASLIGCLRDITDSPVFLRGLPNLYSQPILGNGSLAIDSRYQYSGHCRVSDEALRLFSTWYTANRSFITESMLKRWAQYRWYISYCYATMEADPMADVISLLDQARQMLEQIRREYFLRKYPTADSIIAQALAGDADGQLVFREYNTLNTTFNLGYSAMVARFGMPVNAYPEVLRREGDPLRQYSYYFDTLKDTPGDTAISCLWLIENRLVFEVIYCIDNNNELVPFDALLYNKDSEWLYQE